MLSRLSPAITLRFLSLESPWKQQSRHNLPLLPLPTHMRQCGEKMRIASHATVSDLPTMLSNMNYARHKLFKN